MKNNAAISFPILLLCDKESLDGSNYLSFLTYLKMVFECSIAWCDLGLVRAIVHCQRNHLSKPKFSRNRTISSSQFSGGKFYIGFFFIVFFLVLHRHFLVLLGALGGVLFLEVSDNSHASDFPTSALALCFFWLSTSGSIYCKITISFVEILIFTSTVLGGFFFANFQTRISYFFTM